MRLIRILVAAGDHRRWCRCSRPTAAHATLAGPCTATGTINGTIYNPKTQDSVVIPRDGRGALAGHGQDRPRQAQHRRQGVPEAAAARSARS